VKTIIIIGIVVLVVAGAGYAWMTGGDSKASAAQQEITVRVEPASRGDLIEIVSAPGQLQPKTKVTISAKTTARIMSLPFDEGATVTKGNPQTQPPVPPSTLVKLDSKDLQAQLQAAQARHRAQAAQIASGEERLKAQEAQIIAARAQLLDAERDLRRQSELLHSNDVAATIVDQAQTKVDQFRAQLDAAIAGLDADRASLDASKHQLSAAQAEVARAEEELSYATIYSPIDGVVTRVNAKEGEVVVTGTMNNPGSTILEVSDLSEMQVDAQVDESNVASVKEGQKSKVRISAFPDDLFDGVVKLVGLDVVDPRFGGGGGGGNQSFQGRWYRARVVVDTKGRRIPAGLSADVDIETEVHKNVIKVPTQAVLGRPVDDLPAAVKDRPEVDKNKTLATVVYLVKDGKSAVTPVTIGASDMTHTLITSGLKDGDRIITGPYKILPTLADGVKVKEDQSATTKASTQATTQAGAKS
jgi:HlyD family secretion protein